MPRPRFRRRGGIVVILDNRIVTRPLWMRVFEGADGLSVQGDLNGDRKIAAAQGWAVSQTALFEQKMRAVWKPPLLLGRQLFLGACD